jgi:hypothetical protein
MKKFGYQDAPEAHGHSVRRPSTSDTRSRKADADAAEHPRNPHRNSLGDRFLDARKWGHPFVGPATRLAAPFGWTGILRSTVRDLAEHLSATDRPDLRISSFAMGGSGVEIEMSGSDASARASVHTLASDAGCAALAIDPTTGILNRQGLDSFRRYLDQNRFGNRSPREFEPLIADVRSRPCLGEDLLADLAKAKHTTDLVARRRIPLLASWRLDFPVGFTSVALVGDASTAGSSVTHPIAEPLVALDHLARWARTVAHLYRLGRPRLRRNVAGGLS